jgi:hypothetical protein
MVVVASLFTAAVTQRADGEGAEFASGWHVDDALETGMTCGEGQESLG